VGWSRRLKGAEMPLKRGDIVGYHVNRMSFRFTMMNEGNTIQCEISSVALNDLAGTRGGSPLDKEAQFLTFRDQIEHTANALFDKDGRTPIRIFSKHLRLH
jgi:hypothetical protein